MELQLARMFLESLLERIECDPKTGKNSLPGTLSAHEISALKLALKLLGGENVEPTSAIPSVEMPQIEEPSAESEKISSVSYCKDIISSDVVAPQKIDAILNLRSLDFEKAEDEETILCLDFGTAMSKAFASIVEDDELVKTLPLKLGKRGAKSGQVYPVPSSLWITTEGLIYFGDQALALGIQDSFGGRQRFDSPKKELIMGLVEASPDKVPLNSDINPTKVPFSKGDAITLYLGYLTDMACSELEIKHSISRYVHRRFALPSWEEKRRDWGKKMLSEMLAKAQIIADTFHDRWENGVQIEEARSALDKINKLTELPSYLVGQGVTEPLAAGTSRLRKEEAVRGLAMVIDVGAGTSDFALFVVSEDPKRDLFNAWPIKNCNESLHQAGDTLDAALLQFIIEKSRIESSNPDFPYVVARLRMDLRTMKEELFREKICTFNLSNGDRGIIELDEFLLRPAVKNFADLLTKTFQSVVDKANKSFFERFNGTSLTVVLTGGGATLPMVIDLSEGKCQVHGYDFQKTRAPLVPEEFVDDPELSYVYTQLAVAIGGAMPNLIEERNSINEMPGLSDQKWALNKVQISGV